MRPNASRLLWGLLSVAAALIGTLALTLAEAPPEPSSTGTPGASVPVQSATSATPLAKAATRIAGAARVPLPQDAVVGSGPQ